jgi:hypothetical protein
MDQQEFLKVASIILRHLQDPQEIQAKELNDLKTPIDQMFKTNPPQKHQALSRNLQPLAHRKCQLWID